MSRPVLDVDHIHPAIRDTVAHYQSALLDEVTGAVARHAVVVVGMRMNPFPKRARRALERAGIDHTVLEYGSYFSDWRRRLALKMWTGWPTFPMVFVRGTLIGGATDLQRLIDTGELTRLIGRTG